MVKNSFFFFRCPINRDEVDPSFPRIAMELTDQEIKDYFTPRDFALGIFTPYVSDLSGVIVLTSPVYLSVRLILSAKGMDIQTCILV